MYFPPTTFVSRVFFVAGACLASACLSPTLPLPPPEQPDAIAEAEQDVWEIRGSNTPGSVVLVKNLSNGLISGVEDKDSDGRYVIRVDGKECDRAEVYEIIGTDTTDTTFFVLENVVNGLPDGACPQ